MPAGISQPSNGQKWTRPPTCCRINRNQGRPAWVDLATEPGTSKWKADFAPARSSVRRRQRELPERARPCRGFLDGRIRHRRGLHRSASAVENRRGSAPSRAELMGLEIPQRERKGMVDSDQHRPVLAKPLYQPLGDPATRPILARARRRLDFCGRRTAVGRINPQALQAHGGRFSAGIVDADVAAEGRHGDNGHGRRRWVAPAARALLTWSPRQMCGTSSDRSAITWKS